MHLVDGLADPTVRRASPATSPPSVLWVGMGVAPLPVAVGFQPAVTIDEVLERLDEVVARGRREHSPAGYFAVLYRHVTARVRDAIARRDFEDGERMARLDVAFANRYLEALHCFQTGQPTSRCWQLAFESARRRRLIVLQHLLLGINAHINLDLGAAAAAVCPGDTLDGLRRDFDAINDILCAMLDEMQDRLVRVWPAVALLDKLGCRADEAVLHFSIVRARGAAWDLAATLNRLDGTGGEHWSRELARVDEWATVLARLIRTPGVKGSLAALLIRLGELRGVPRVLDALV